MRAADSPMRDDVASSERADRRRPSRAQAVEGYLALVCVGLTFVGMALGEAVPYPAGPAIGITLWALAWLFAISGVRRGQGGAKAAAWVSLVVLVWHAGFILLIAFH